MIECSNSVANSDFSLEKVSRADLQDDRGLLYQEFRRTLKPNRIRIGLDIALGYAALLVTGVLATIAAKHFQSTWLIICALSAVLFGYWMAYLQLFIHEAAHFNLASDRRWNDRLANCFIGVWVGVHVESYRMIHLGHHRFHGEPSDTEHSYFSPLDGKFLLKALLGIKAIEVLSFRRKRVATQRIAMRNTVVSSGTLMLLLAGLVHLIIVGSLSLDGYWWVAVAWVAGMTVFFPLFGALRQILEHRSGHALSTVDYSVVPHGRSTRMFREGVIGSTFGAAGFTRHLLHHWDPSISYTNLAEVENFLSRCEETNDIQRHKITYQKAFLTLYAR